MAGKLLTMLESVDGIDDVGDMDRDVVGGNAFDGGGYGDIGEGRIF